jgi:ABC-type ATPase with predicted acetyltransferase domain
MVLIRFPDGDSKRRALGYLAGRFSFKSWASGEMTVPETALAYLAAEDIPFSVEGQATCERLISAVRDPAAAKVLTMVSLYRTS